MGHLLVAEASPKASLPPDPGPTGRAGVGVGDGGTASQGYTFNPSTGNTASVTFNSSTVRYVRLSFTANTGRPTGQLSELQVFIS